MDLVQEAIATGKQNGPRQNMKKTVCLLVFLAGISGCANHVAQGRLYESTATFTEMQLIPTSDIAEIRSNPETVLWQGNPDLFFADGTWEYTEYKTVEKLVIDPPAIPQQVNPVSFKTGAVVRTSNYSIHFDFDQSKLRPDAKKVLDGLDKLGVDRVLLSGHTDAIGTNPYNDELSSRRAKSVRAYLQTKGWSDGIFNVEAHGKLAPIASNKDSTGRALNRRVEIRLSLVGDKQ